MSYTFSSLLSLFSLLSFPTVFRMDFSSVRWLRWAGLSAFLSLFTFHDSSPPVHDSRLTRD